MKKVKIGDTLTFGNMKWTYTGFHYVKSAMGEFKNLRFGHANGAETSISVECWNTSMVGLTDLSSADFDGAI